MSDFRIGGPRSNRPQGGPRQAPPTNQGPERGPWPENGFGDEISPELAARMRERRERRPAPPADFQRPESGENCPPPRHRGPRPHRQEGEFNGPRGPRPDAAERPVPQQPTAEELFARLDTDGDGNVTLLEAQAALSAEQAAPAPEEPLAVEPEPVAEEEAPVVETPDYAAIQTQVLEQLASLQSQEGLTDEQKVLLEETVSAVQALDPTDVEFETQLTTALAPIM